MDCPVFAQYQPVLSRFSVQNQHRILRYLAGLAARQYADGIETGRDEVILQLRRLAKDRTQVGRKALGRTQEPLPARGLQGGHALLGVSADGREVIPVRIEFAEREVTAEDLARQRLTPFE